MGSKQREEEHQQGETEPMESEESQATWDIEKDILVDLSRKKQVTINFKDLAKEDPEKFLLHLQAVLPIEVSLKRFTEDEAIIMAEKMYISLASPTFKKLRFYVRPCKSKSGKQVQAYETDDGKKLIDHVYHDIFETTVPALPESEITKEIKFMIAKAETMLVLPWDRFFKGPLSKSCEPLAAKLSTEEFADQILNTRVKWFPEVYSEDGQVKPEYIEKYKARLHKEISSSISTEIVEPKRPSSSKDQDDLESGSQPYNKDADTLDSAKPKKPKSPKAKETTPEKKKTSKSSSSEDPSEEGKKTPKKARKPKAKEDDKAEEETTPKPAKKAKKAAVNPSPKGMMDITISVPKDDKLQSISQGDIITAVETFSSLMGIKPSRMVPLLCALHQINEAMENKT